MVKEIFGYERIRDIPEEELMHLTKTYGYSPLLQFLHSRYLKEKNDRHYPMSVARTAIYFSNPHWLHHQLQKNHLDWIEDQEPVVTHIPTEHSFIDEDQHEEGKIYASEPEIDENIDIQPVGSDEPTLENVEKEEVAIGQEIESDNMIAAADVDEEERIIVESIPEETAARSEDIYTHTLLDESEMSRENEESTNKYIEESEVEDNIDIQPVELEEPTQANVEDEKMAAEPEIPSVALLVAADVDEVGQIIAESIPEETATRSEDIYTHTLLGESEISREAEMPPSEFHKKDSILAEEQIEVAEMKEVDAITEIESEKEAPAVAEEREPEQFTTTVYPEFDTIHDTSPILDADTGFDEGGYNGQVGEVLPPAVEDPEPVEVFLPQSVHNEQEYVESDADNTDGEETERDLPAPAFRPISFPVETNAATTLGFEPLYAVDYFASQGVKLSLEDESRDQLTTKLKSFTEWLKSMKRIHPEKLSHELDEKTELTIKTVAEHSNEKGEILTETMAEIFMKQGLVEKSMEVYEKLSLLYPSKSDYFAAKISELKAIGT